MAWDDLGPALETVDGWVRLRFLLARTGSAFAGIHDRAVVTYGDPEAGGDSSSVQHLLINVHRIRGCERSFAAILPSYRLLVFCVLALFILPVAGGSEQSSSPAQPSPTLGPRGMGPAQAMFSGLSRPQRLAILGFLFILAGLPSSVMHMIRQSQQGFRTPPHRPEAYDMSTPPTGQQEPEAGQSPYNALPVADLR